MCPDLCPCGNPLPAIRVQGPPPTCSRSPKRMAGGFRSRRWRWRWTKFGGRAILDRADHPDESAGALERAEERPEQSPGGKYRTIIPLSRDNRQ